VAGIADCRLPIAGIRNSKLEIRNSEKTPLRGTASEFRFSNFDFPLPQSTRRGGAISNRQSPMAGIADFPAVAGRLPVFETRN
jgi:hypothetical protein